MQLATPLMRRTTLGRVALGVAASVPFLMSFGFHAVEREPTVPVEAPPRPSLAFAHYVVDRGPLPPGPLARGTFHFTNTGTRPLTITKLVPSCGCLQPALAGDKKTYQPGESGSFEVRVRTANESPGPQQYFVKVHYADPAPRDVEVAFKAVFPERQVRVQPPALMVYRPDDGRPMTQEIVVSDFRGRPMRLTGVRVLRSSSVAAELGEVDESQPGARRAHVRVTIAGQIPEKRHEAVVVIDTDDPTYPQVVVPVYVQRLDAAAGGFGRSAPAKE